MAGGFGAALREARNATGAGDSVGQAWGGFKTRLFVPGHPRRVAYTLRRAATSGATRPADSEPVGHDSH